MSAYIIVNIQVTDPVPYAEYIKGTPPTIARYNGRFLARGGPAEKLEGDYEPRRVVVLEFDTFENAKAWWDSEEYRDLRDLRQRSAITDMILVDGVAAPVGGAR
jgi:uncharacterized protein (DUF1330 family)